MKGLLEHEPLLKYTTLKVGGPARYLCAVSDISQVQQARDFARQQNVPVVVLGHGSNVFFSEAGFDGLVILNEMKQRAYDTSSNGVTRATFGSGEDFDEIVAETVSRGLWGLENLSHIPGTVGATPVQNVGAYGVEVSDLIDSVSAVDLETGKEKVFTARECQFAYRDSYFKTDEGRNWFITSVTFCLSQDPDTAVLNYKDLQSFAVNTSELRIQAIRDEIIRIRSAKFPDWQQVGTAGSFFKNPIITESEAMVLSERFPDMPQYQEKNGDVKVSLGWILDHVCGLRGYCEHDVCLSSHQALVLINHSNSAQLVQNFVTKVTAVVYEKTGIQIEPEVRFL